MSDIIVKKLKKYVLYISTVFFVWIWIHLIYTYLYEGSQSEAIEGGTISEAIIGSFPHLNPLVPSNDYNAYINNLLYRSMLTYSAESDSFEADLVSCNLDNLLYIECILESNLTWSDGSDITPEDIKATLEIIAETKVNPIIASLLKDTTIETTKDSISFSNTSKDINFLHIFLQPILPKTIIENLDTENIDGKFSEVWGIYSGRFVLSSISQDETVWITKITLWKNKDYFGNDMYINFLILNLFRDEAHFLKNKNSFNIFNDPDFIIGSSIPRLNIFEYTLSQFVGSFFNSETLSSDMRNYISHTLNRDTIISNVWAERVHPSYNPFLSDMRIDTSLNTDFNLADYLEDAWYHSKKELLKSTLAVELEQKKQDEAEKIISGEAQIIEPETPKKPVQEELRYINSPTTQKYNFTSEDNILISGSVPSEVEAVYINDYKLTGFSAGDDIFYYRLLEEYDSIVDGENTYKVFFETGKELELVDEFVYIYEKNTDTLTEIEANFFQWSSSEVSEEAPAEIDTPEESASGTLSSTGSETTEEETQQLESDIETTLTSQEISSLDDRFYYNADGEAYTIKLVYAQTDSLMEKTVNVIKNLLESNGIGVELQSLSLGDITVALRNESLEYDIALLGINLGYFESNIYPYFHSSQVKNGYNFSNFKKLGLDILLEELKSNNLSSTKRDELEAKILDILKQENVVKVFYTPKIALLVDKNIKNFSLPSYLPDSKHRHDPLTEAYLSERRIIMEGEKSIFGFIGFLFSKLFG